MRRDREVTLVIFNVVVKLFHKCPLPVERGDEFAASKKRADCGNASKVTDSQGQLHHSQRDSVAPLWQIKKSF